VHREAVRADAVQVGALQRTLTVTEARSILPELLDRVADGEEITITRHGEWLPSF
jgi:hypothetical protein